MNRFLIAARSWVARNLIADDPYPEPSRLDLLDRPRPSCITNQAAFDALAQRMYGKPNG